MSTTKAHIQWLSSDNIEYIYHTIIQQQNFFIRLNDFPEETMYSLMLEDIRLLDFDDWPTHWNRPV